MNIGIYLFDGVEALDFAAPYEVFTTAARMHGRAQAPEEPPLFSVCSIALELRPIQARAGLRVLPEFTCANHPVLEVLVVPGGVVDGQLAHGAVAPWIAQQAQQVKVLASVCTGAFLLAQAGCLDGLTATTHWEDVALVRTSFPKVRVQDGPRWVDQGRVVTSAGISAGIDMSLHLVQRLHSRALAQRTARQMQFDWQENPA